MKVRLAYANRAFALVLAAAALFLNASTVWAGPKCPNRYFRKVEAKSIGETMQKAKDGYPDALAAAVNKTKNDCDNCECEEEDETCTYQHTELKKPKCFQKAGQPNDFRCVGWIRPGCFCMNKDEALITASPAPAG